MTSFSTISAMRFGTGLSPRFTAPDTSAALLDSLRGPDEAAVSFPMSSFAKRMKDGSAFLKLKQAARRKEDGAERAFKAHRKQMRIQILGDRVAALSRAAFARDSFRERLTMFWADHFTTVARGPQFTGIVTTYVNEAIRPHVTGRFADLVRSAVLHPVMLVYLDQSSSFGPNSALGKKRNKGLNENLAREVMELHTLGVGGSYTQEDVRQLAELFTGLSADIRRGFVFRRKMAEPGAETVLGRSYGGMKPRLEDIHAVLDDLSTHPDTARHIARKLAVHFVSDDPDPGLVDDIAAAFTETGGDLMACYEAMLDHLDAWDTFGAKARRPDEFVIATLRALDVPHERLTGMTLKQARDLLFGPMTAMGQKWEEPKGPDGWAEEDEAWITPQGLAGRIQWAMVAPRAFTPRLVDPRDFVRVALADAASDATAFAAEAAESRWEGVGLVLSSPEFNRR
ncbi:MAG: DUF1800 domain-containing protein [Brevirhabdus sp.]